MCLFPTNSFCLLKKKKTDYTLSVLHNCALTTLPACGSAEREWPLAFFFFNQEKWKHKEWNKCWKLSFTGTIKTMQAVCSHNTCLLIKTCRGKNSNFCCRSQNVRTVLIKLVLYGAEKHVLPVPSNKTLSQTWQLSKLPKTSLFCLVSLEHISISISTNLTAWTPYLIQKTKTSTERYCSKNTVSYVFFF